MDFFKFLSRRTTCGEVVAAATPDVDRLGDKGRLLGGMSPRSPTCIGEKRVMSNHMCALYKKGCGMSGKV